jgi:uncharacterized protein
LSLPSPSPDTAALVTGASAGIGACIARELAKRGHGLVLVARRRERLEELAKELSDAHGIRAEAIGADLSKAASVARLPGRIESLGLEVDVLVNNAGFATGGPFYESDPERELEQVRVLVEAPVALISAYAPQMVKRGSGAILNVASTAAFQPLPYSAGYSAAKAYVLSYTQSLAGELRGTGVSATVLCPGPVATNFADTAGFTQEQAETALPKILWRPADEVARCGIDALDKGRMVAIPGTLNRLSAYGAWLSPRSVLVPFVARRHPGLR